MAIIRDECSKVAERERRLERILLPLVGGAVAFFLMSSFYVFVLSDDDASSVPMVCECGIE